MEHPIVITLTPASWRWIFILEGIFTVVVAAASYWLVPDWPETARFLKPEERELLIARLALDVEHANMSHWNKMTAKRVFSDIKIYLGSVLQFRRGSQGLTF
jgi:sugar phosphate permease